MRLPIAAAAAILATGVIAAPHAEAVDTTRPLAVNATPREYPRGVTNYKVFIGARFMIAPATVTFSRDVTIRKTQFQGRRFALWIDVAPDAAPGPITVTVTNANGKSNTCKRDKCPVIV